MPGRYRRFLIGESVGFVLYAAGRFDNSLGVFKAIWPLIVAFICFVRAIAVGRVAAWNDVWVIGWILLYTLAFCTRRIIGFPKLLYGIFPSFAFVALRVPIH